MEDEDPVYRQLPPARAAREGRMPPRDDRIDWGLWFVVALIFVIGAVGVWFIWIMIMASEMDKNIG